MSLWPFLRAFWDEPWEGMSQPSRLFDQHFGNMITDADDFFRPAYGISIYPRVQQTPMQPPQQTGVSEVVNTDKEFRISMDMQHFKPEEINIKTKDNRVIISGRHEERPDEHGFISRQFVRQYVLPKDVNPATVSSTLSREGLLMLKAPKMAQEAPKETVIPITMEKDKGDE